MRAKRLRISDKVMTPVKRPEMRAPGRDAADTAGNEGEGGTEPLPLGGATTEACARDGVAGAEGDGDAGSTTHMR